MSGTHPPSRWALVLRRRLGLEANPVRRATDHAEAWVRIGLTVLFLIAAPVAAIGMGHWAATSMQSEARAQAAAEHLVPATLVVKAPGGSRYSGVAALTWAPARWTGPDGTTRAGEVNVRAGAPKGTVVRVWTDATGRLVKPPLAHAQIVSREITVTALSPVGVALLLLITAGVIHRMLERRRMAAWEADWDAVEPQWTRRLQ